MIPVNYGTSFSNGEYRVNPIYHSNNPNYCMSTNKYTLTLSDDRSINKWLGSNLIASFHCGKMKPCGIPIYSEKRQLVYVPVENEGFLIFKEETTGGILTRNGANYFEIWDVSEIDIRNGDWNDDETLLIFTNVYDEIFIFFFCFIVYNT